MKRNYERKAWYLDDGILISGVKDKYGFRPDRNVECGFSLQKLTKKMIGIELFYNLKDALKKTAPVSLAGGNIRITYDKGLYLTKYCISDSIDTIYGKILTSELSGNIAESILIFAGFKNVHYVKPEVKEIDNCIHYNEEKGVFYPLCNGKENDEDFIESECKKCCLYKDFGDEEN